MRPGPQRPGNMCAVFLLRRWWFGFNEAGATTPRKRSGPRGPTTASGWLQ